MLLNSEMLAKVQVGVLFLVTSTSMTHVIPFPLLGTMTRVS